MVTEILALPEPSARADALLEQLKQLHLWRRTPELDQAIVDGIDHLAVTAGLGGARLGDRLPRLLWELCNRFVGPEHVDLDQEDKEHVQRCIKALGSLGSFNAAYGRRDQVLDELGLSFESFSNLARSYSEGDLLRAVIHALGLCLEAGREETLYLPGQHVALRSLHDIAERLVEDEIAWSAELDLIRNLDREYGLAYFRVSSKEGEATLDIEFAAGGQILIVGVHPNDAVPEVLPLLEPAFAHYASQWKKIMVPDPDETDVRGFFVEAKELPERIAPAENKKDIDEIVTKHLSPLMKGFFGKMLPVPALSPYQFVWSSQPDYLLPPEDVGVTKYPDAGT